jgi:hypothetical protein
MRYVWGLLAVWCLIKYLKTSRLFWIVLNGALTAVAFLTSIEIGVSALCTSFLILILKQDSLRNISAYILSVALPFLLFCAYFLSQGALVDYWENQRIVATQMTQTFIQSEPVPGTIGEVLKSLFVVTDKNFRQMTPVYCYVFFFAAWIYRWRRKMVNVLDWGALGVVFYGLAIYVTGFRNLWSSVFEMSLQPEKIVLFYLLAQGLIWMNQKHGRWVIVYKIALVAIILSSFGFSLSRLYKRFFSVRWAMYAISGRDTSELKPLSKETSSSIHFPRVQDMVVPSQQAEDIVQLQKFVDEHIDIGEPIWMYPELGTMHFLLDRPWVGKHAIPILSWMDGNWFDEYDQTLRAQPPRYAVWNKKVPEFYEKIHLSVPSNREKFEKHLNFLHANYSVITTTPTYNIYVYKAKN